MSAKFHSTSLFFIVTFAACAEELTSAQVQEKICQAGGDAAYCDSGKRVSEVENPSDAASSDAEVAQVIDTGEELALQSDANSEADATETDAEVDVPEPDVPEVGLSDTADAETGTGEDDDVVDDGEVEVEGSETMPETLDDAEIVLPDIATPEDAGIDLPDIPTAEVADIDQEVEVEVSLETQEDVPETSQDVDVDAAPDMVQPKCLSNEGCDDGNLCTVDLCEQATCTTKPVICDDGNACTNDLCVGTLGCVTVPNSAICTDLNACTIGETCSKGSCGGGKKKDCEDSNPCTQDSCNPSQGCVATPLVDGTKCGVDLACKAGACTEFVPPLGMVLIPGGKFFIGCNSKFDGECQADEMPQHEVDISTFFIDQNEVKVSAYKECVDAGACQLPVTGSNCMWGSGKDNLPVNCLSWPKADAYCLWKGKRLPNEAEWEKSARGGCDKYQNQNCSEAMPRFPWGDAPHNCTKANADTCGGAPVPVGSFPAGVSVYGILDLSGNVWEWTASWHVPYPFKPNAPATSERVMRGGAYGSGTMHIRTSRRSPQSPGSEAPYLGFRCAKSVK